MPPEPAREPRARPCPDCGADYPPNERSGRFRLRCEDCRYQRSLEVARRNKQLLEQRHPGYVRTYARAYYAKNRARYIEKATLYRKAHAHVDLTNRARQRGAVVIELFSAQEIFDRDEWTCMICRQPIDRALRFPAPRSASVDHIQPISRGGEHSRANCAAAHLACNQSRWRWLERRARQSASPSVAVDDEQEPMRDG